jgi:hypothetical protein
MIGWLIGAWLGHKGNSEEFSFYSLIVHTIFCLYCLIDGRYGSLSGRHFLHCVHGLACEIFLSLGKEGSMEGQGTKEKCEVSSRSCTQKQAGWKTTVCIKCSRLNAARRLHGRERKGDEGENNRKGQERKADIW